MDNAAIVAIILVIALIIIYFVIAKPGSKKSNNDIRGAGNFHTIEDKYNAQRREKEVELDLLLDKIAKNGIESLSKKERERLDFLSNKKQ